MVNEKRVSNWEGNYNYLLFAPFASLNLLVGERKQTTHCVRVPIVVNESVQSREQVRGGSKLSMPLRRVCNSHACYSRRLPLAHR